MTTIRDYSARAFDAQAVASAPIGESDRIEICLLDDISRARRAFAVSIVEKHGRATKNTKGPAARQRIGNVNRTMTRAFRPPLFIAKLRSSPHAAHLGG